MSAASPIAGRVAAELEPYGVTYHRQYGRTGWCATCACGATERVSGTPVLQPSFTIRKFEHRGWSLRARTTPVCPACHTKETPVNKPVQIGPDPKIARKIYALLDEHFDDQKRMYRNGCSDEVVAKTLDVSLEIVKNIRVAAYGELAEDPRYAKLRDDIELLRMEFAEEHAKLYARFEGQLTALEAQIPARNKKAAG